MFGDPGIRTTWVNLTAAMVLVFFFLFAIVGESGGFAALLAIRCRTILLGEQASP